MRIARGQGYRFCLCEGTCKHASCCVAAVAQLASIVQSKRLLIMSLNLVGGSTIFSVLPQLNQESLAEFEFVYIIRERPLGTTKKQPRLTFTCGSVWG